MQAVEPDDEVFVIVPHSVAQLIRSLVEARSTAALPERLRPFVAPYLDKLASASIEARGRQGLRDMFPEVSASKPARIFFSLDAANRAIASGIVSRPRRAAPADNSDLGWVTDWARSHRYGGAAVAFVLASS